MTLTGEGSNQAILPDYNELDRELESLLLHEALSQNPELRDSTAPFVLLTIDGQSPYSNIARALECKQFNNYFGNSPEEMQDEYAPYEDSSTFFLIVDRERLHPAGVMRLIRPNENGFKSMNDINTWKCQTDDGEPATTLTHEEIYQKLGIDPQKTVDIATIAAHPEYTLKATGNPIVLAALMRALREYSFVTNAKDAATGASDAIAIIDSMPLGQLNMVSLPVKTLPEIAAPFKYLGAKGNTFIHVPGSEVEESVSNFNRQVYDYLFGDAALNGDCQLSLTEQ